VRTHAPGFLQTGQAVLAGLYSPNQDKAERLASQSGFSRVYTSVAELCEDPAVDLVVVSSPNLEHVDQVRYALECRKHVLCEKPLALSVAECRFLVDQAAAEPGRLAVVNNQLRFSPYLRLVREIVRSQRFGRVFHARILQQGTAWADPGVPWSWSFDASCGGGVRWAMGAHLVDLANFLFEQPTVSVHGSMHTVIPKRRKGDVDVSVDAELEFSGVMNLADDVQVMLSAVGAAHSGFRFDIQIFCEHGEVRFDLENKVCVFWDQGRRSESFVDIPELKEGDRDNSKSFFSGTFRYYADAIVAALLDGEVHLLEGATSFSDGLETVRILEAFKEAKDSSSVAVVRRSPEA